MSFRLAYRGGSGRYASVVCNRCGRHARKLWHCGKGMLCRPCTLGVLQAQCPQATILRFPGRSPVRKAG